MKLIKKLLGLLLILGGCLFVAAGITKNSTSEVAAIVDQLNPLVKESFVYIKTKEPDKVNEYGTAYYEQLAANEKGEARKIAFNGLSELKVGHYLKLTNKGAHVESYEEVSKEEVPKKALAEID